MGLFRYGLIRQAADPELTTRARGRLVRDLAAAEHTGPFGRPGPGLAGHAWTAGSGPGGGGGFDALMPRPAPGRSHGPPAQMLELAAALKREAPERTAAQIAAILAAACRLGTDERTLQRHFARLELNTRPDGRQPAAFGRFEAAAPNERWTGDALHGPKVDGRKTYLFAFIDDHSRALVGYRWGHSEDTVRLEAALRAGSASRGVPQWSIVDYADPVVMPTSMRTGCSAGVTGPMMSA